MNKKRTVPVALQLYSVRGDMEQDFEGTLRAVGEMGYDGVELVGLYGRKPEAVREAVAAAGLVPVSAHVPYAEMAADPDGVMAAYAAAGCAYIAVPYLEEACRPGHDGFSDVIAALPKLGEAAGRAGLTLLYHNHDFEFTKVEGQYGLDLMYQRVPASLLQTELDTCWINVAGEDPAAYVRKYAGRCPIVHLKDIKSLEPFAFAEVGGGLQDIPSIIAAAEQSGAEWLVVEQDRWEMDSLDSARISRENLRKLGQ